MKLTTQFKILLAGAAAFLICTALAIAFYPHYDFWGQFLSELGIWETSKLSAFFFNSGTVITAVLLAIFFITLQSRNTLRKAARALGVIGAFSLGGVGIFPMNSAAATHYFFALLFFAVFGIALACLALESCFKKRLGTPLALLFIATAASAAALFLTMMPWLQKTTIALYLLWLLAFAWKK